MEGKPRRYRVSCCRHDVLSLLVVISACLAHVNSSSDARTRTKSLADLEFLVDKASFNPNDSLIEPHELNVVLVTEAAHGGRARFVGHERLWLGLGLHLQHQGHNVTVRGWVR